MSHALTRATKVFRILRNTLYAYYRLPGDVEAVQRAIGRIEERQLRLNRVDCLADNEFSVFSEWGEDGIIQFLVRTVPIDRKIFVEFGVEKYREANTRFLLQNNYWSGLVIDGSSRHIEHIVRDPLYWKYNLKVDCSFITASNIDEILARNGIQGDIGLLSIDIDGNDYWVWKAMSSIRPRIVICEYNSLFGSVRKVTIPYDEQFTRASAHHSWLYFGASLPALTSLADSKGYALVGSNSAGSNAFFVRKDVLGSLPVRSAAEVYRWAQFRESRDESGRLTFLSFDERLKALSDLPVLDLDLEKLVAVGELETSA